MNNGFNSGDGKALGVVLQDDVATRAESANDVICNLARGASAASVTGGNVPVEIGEAGIGDLAGEAAHDVGTAIVAAADSVGTAAWEAHEVGFESSGVFDAILDFVKVGEEVVGGAVDI